MRIGLSVLLALAISISVPNVVAAGSSSTPNVSSAGSSAVTRVSLTPRSDSLGYVVRIHTTESVKAFSALRSSGDNAYELTLFASSIASSYQSTALPSPVLSNRIVPSGNDLIFRFAVTGPYQASVYRDRGSTDILVGLERVDGLVPVTPVQLAPKGPTDSARQRWKLDTIVIDAGHGGKDPGTSAFGFREKDITLAIARKLGSYLESELGVRVIYTRSDDRFVDLEDRGKIANESGGKLFVSIHVNAARNRNASGTETYFLGMHKSATAREVMERENAVISLEENQARYSDYTQDGLIRLTLAQSAYMHQSELLASRIERQFRERVGRGSRGVKQAGFIVLWAASMPAVLVETGFVTNREEARFLASDIGQTYVASGIFRAIRDFKENYEKDLNLAGRSAN